MGTVTVISSYPRVARRKTMVHSVHYEWLEVFVRLIPKPYFLEVIAILPEDREFGPIELRTESVWNQHEVPFDTLTEEEQGLVWEMMLTHPDWCVPQ